MLRGASQTATASFVCLPSAGPSLARPLRRVELTLSDPLLERVTLVGVRAAPAVGRASRDEGRRDEGRCDEGRRDEAGHGHGGHGQGGHAGLVADLVRQSESVILAADGRGPFQPAEIDLLRLASELGKGVFFAVTHADENAEWPEVVRVNQTTLARQVPDLALRPWHTVSRSATSVLELRDSVLAWSRDQRRPRRRRAPAIRVAPAAAESGWKELLRVEVDRAHRSVVGCAERDLGRLRELTLAGRLGVEEFGRRLRILSVALAAEAHTGVDAAVESVLRRVLTQPPDTDVLDRVAVALQRDVAQRCCGATTCFRVLRVTGTAAAAIATAGDAAASASLLPERTSGVLPPLSIGLTTNCVPMTRRSAEETEDIAANAVTDRERDWVTRALDSLERELYRELTRQFTYLGQATSDLIVDGLDHDLLLV